MNSLLPTHIFNRSALSLALVVGLSACSALNKQDHQVKDSLYVWSDAFDESFEANKVVTDYQTIKALEDSIPKSDVQMIFEAMVNNEIPDIDLSNNDTAKPEETLKERHARLKEYNEKLKQQNEKLREALISKKSLEAQPSTIKLEPNADATLLTVLAPLSDKETEKEAAKETAKVAIKEAEIEPVLVSQPPMLAVVESAVINTASAVSVIPVSEKPEPSTLSAEIKKTADAEPVEFVASSKPTLNTVEDINRLTQSNPTAAGIGADKVLPVVKPTISDIALPTEIMALSDKAGYQPNQTEYGMWQLTKGQQSQYQEVCSLSSSTVQLEDENYTTQVWINVVGNNLLVNSTTNIDIKKPGVGLRFDNGDVQKFTKKYFQTSAIWTGNINSALGNHKKLNIRLSGNELGQRTQELSISLNDLKGAYTEYRQCNQGIQIGSL